METPDSTPPTEAGAETYLTGEVVPKSSGSDQSAFDAPGPDEDEASEAASGRVWPFLFEPRWIAWHLFVAAAFCGMLWLGDWQYRRAMDGNGLSWAYTFEWPLFAVFGIVFWARTIRDEFRAKRGIDTVIQNAYATDLPDGMGTVQIEGVPDDADDPELASYNAYLRKLNARESAKAKAITSGRKAITRG